MINFPTLSQEHQIYSQHRARSCRYLHGWARSLPGAVPARCHCPGSTASCLGAQCFQVEPQGSLTSICPWYGFSVFKTWIFPLKHFEELRGWACSIWSWWWTYVALAGAADWHTRQQNVINPPFGPPCPMEKQSSWPVPCAFITLHPHCCLLKKITQHLFRRHPISAQSHQQPTGPCSRAAGHRAPLLTSAWCSSFCWRTSITNSARRIVSSNFLAGVTNRPTFSVVQEVELKGRQSEKPDVKQVILEV